MVLKEPEELSQNILTELFARFIELKSKKVSIYEKFYD